MHKFLSSLILPLFITTAALADSPSQEEGGYYSGVLGDHQKISMMLYVRDGSFVGTYRYAQYGSPIWLNAVPTKGDQLVLKESLPQSEDKTDSPSAQFKGAFTEPDEFSGTWSSADKKRKLPFQLHRFAHFSEFGNKTPHYSIEQTIPQFEKQTAFYTALNATLSKKAKKSIFSTVTEYEKLTSDMRADEQPYENRCQVEVLYADDSLVSLNYETYDFTGGAHGNTYYSAATYAWQNNTLVEVPTLDLISARSRNTINTLLLRSLKRQKAGWPEDLKEIPLKSLVINPTANGLVFTFAPYEVDCFASGTYTVMLPYKTLPNVIRSDSVISRFVDSETPTDSAAIAP